MASSLITKVYNASKFHTATVIVLHGLGGCRNGENSLTPEVLEMSQSLKHVKFILPEAPIQPTTINYGLEMASWYDVYALADIKDPLKTRVNEEDLLSSVALINQLIRDEIDAGIPSNRIVIGGISQGAGTSITVGLLSEYPLAGIMDLSGYIPLNDKTFTMATDANKNTPIFLGHGDCDTTVPLQIGELTRDILESRGYSVTFKVYNELEHWISSEEIQDMISFLQQVIPEQNSK